MPADIYNIDNINKVYRYLEYTTLANRKDKKVMNDACDLLRKGKPFSQEMENQLKDLFALYRGMTLN